MTELLTYVNAAVLIVGTAGGIYLWKAEKAIKRAEAGKTDAEAAELIKDASVDLLRPLTDRISALEKEVRKLKKAVQEATENEARLNDIIDQKNERIAALEAELDGAHREREAMKAAINHLKQRLTDAGINGE